MPQAISVVYKSVFKKLKTQAMKLNLTLIPVFFATALITGIGNVDDAQTKTDV